MTNIIYWLMKRCTARRPVWLFTLLCFGWTKSWKLSIASLVLNFFISAYDLGKTFDWTTSWSRNASFGFGKNSYMQANNSSRIRPFGWRMHSRRRRNVNRELISLISIRRRLTTDLLSVITKEENDFRWTKDFTHEWSTTIQAVPKKEN